MSFSTDIKKEIAERSYNDAGEITAGLAAVLSCIGTFTCQNNDFDLVLTCDNESVIRKCFTLLAKTANINCEFHSSSGPDGSIRISDYMTSAQILEIGMMTGRIRNGHAEAVHAVSQKLLNKEAAVRSYLGCMFLTIGSASDPEKEYDLEFVARDINIANQIQKLLTERDISARQMRRRNQTVVYIRDSEGISDTLNLIGAPVAMMRFENARIVRGVRGVVNRKVNCEAANIRKSVTAAGRQIEDIRLIIEKGNPADLPDGLRTIAELRLNNPDVSLKELGEMLDPPVGKSGVNHRLRKISEYAAGIRDLPADDQSGHGGD